MVNLGHVGSGRKSFTSLSSQLYSDIFSYFMCNRSDDNDLVLDAKCHYLQACISGCILSLGDCAYVEVS